MMRKDLSWKREWRKREADLVIWQREMGATFGLQNSETLSFLTKSTFLIPSGIQILLSYYSSNSFDNEWSCWMLLSGRCDRGLQLLLDHTESGCKRTEEDRKLIVFAFIRSCRSTPSRGWSSVIPFSFLWCLESNTKEMITHNEVVFGNETDRLSGGNISCYFTESMWYS